MAFHFSALQWDINLGYPIAWEGREGRMEGTMGITDEPKLTILVCMFKGKNNHWLLGGSAENSPYMKT